MKHYLALGLLSSLLLTSCSVDWNDAKEKKIGELEKQVVEMKKEKEDDLFKKKQECLNLFNSIDSRIKSYNKESDYKISLEEVFYSPRLQQCIYIDYFDNGSIKRLMSVGSNPGGNPINDLSCEYKTEGDIGLNDKCSIFDLKIKELKGE